MNKKEEIGILEVLRTSDSYFADMFENNDILLMQRNIEDDMPLLLGTGYIKFRPDEIKILKAIMLRESICNDHSSIQALCEKFEKEG